MAGTRSDIVVEASAADVMTVIADFEAYPNWAVGMTSAQILERDARGRAREVRFTVDAAPIRDTFTLRYDWSELSVSWQLADDGSMMRAMDGAYTLNPLSGGGTRVDYQLVVALTMPMLGMLRRKAEKVVVDSALRGLKREVERRA